MKISYIIMGFPTPTETFASIDIKAVRDRVNKVNVYSLRPKHKKHNSMIRDRNLVDINIVSINYLKIILSPIIIFLYPLKTIELIIWLVKLERNNLFQLMKCLLLIPSSIYIYSKIKKDLPDVVHLFWGHYPSITGYLIQKYLPGTTMTMFLGAYDLELNLAISNYIASKTKCVFTHSKINIDILKLRGIKESKIKLVYRSVDYNFIKECTKEIKKIDKKIISSGRLIKEKKFDLVIHKFSELLKYDSLFTLEIIGSGPEKSRLIKLSKDLNIDEKVNFISHVSQVDLFKKMASAEYFLFLSEKKSERLSNVIKEAMACGCICISSNTLGINELIIDGVNGYVLKNTNNFDFKDYFIKSKDVKNSLINNSEITIKNNFNISNSHQQYINIWEKIKHDYYL
ncbi:glycosyltransferase [Pelagibacteraceae bacterium]|nr:glycosyltransferase [Pelagibacteraceae bacterium]